MTKRMLIDGAHLDETRVVLLEDDQIYDYDFVSTSKTQTKGNIYLAKITRVEPSLQAAFVEYGGGKQGFLPFSEIHPDYYQLPHGDKQKLLDEQIAEAEAEEAAEDAAFEREQAAREARRSRGDMSEPDVEDEEFTREAEVDEAVEAAREALYALGADDAGEGMALAALPSLPPTDATETFAADHSVLEEVKPLETAQFAVYSDPVDADPLDVNSAISTEGAEAFSADTSESHTEADQGEENEHGGRGRGGRSQSPHRRYRIQEVIKRNQIVLVQVIKEERGNKGASLTTFISLAGRAAVLMPNSPKGGGISRKITDRETRKRLKEVASEMRTHRGMSVIIRTAGIDRTKDEIRKDFEYLVSVWNTVREQTLAATAPALIYEEGNLIKRSLRDLYTSDVNEIMVQGDAAYEEARSFMNMLMPSHIERIKHYNASMPLFSSAGVEDQLAAMSEPQVRLPSGGYLVINPTEALISIDVNSGRSTTERNVEETAVKTNLEAAYEVARQLRLRDLAGLVVVDFIDMSYGKNRKQVERAMKDALKADRAKIQVGRISMFGLLELSRQRLRPSMAESMGIMCPHCKGTGYVHSVETVGIQIIRSLEKEAASGEYVTLKVTTHPEAALYLLNEKRSALQSLEQRYGVSVTVLMDTVMITGNYRMVKITADGREIMHDPLAALNRSNNIRGRARRGRRGGREENAPSTTTETSEETSTTERTSETSETGERGERSNRRERGGRNRNRNRTRRPAGEGVTETDSVVASQENTHASSESTVTSIDAGEEGENGQRASGNRRRGRRGGRNRNRGPRSEQGSGDDTVVATEAFSPAAASRDSDIPTSYSSSAESTPAPVKSFVVPLSEAQTNPSAVASPIISESSTGDDKSKRKGWWSRVLEN